MSVFSMAGSNPALPTYPLQRSVRLRSSASAYFNRTFGTPTNNLKWTFSTWAKRGAMAAGGAYQLFGSGDSAASNLFGFRFGGASDDQLYIFQAASGAYNLQAQTSAVFRDPSSWYHIVLVYDSANATSTDRIIVYVNNVRQTITYTTGPFAQNTAAQANSARQNNIGAAYYAAASSLFDGYLTEINFIDGQALTPSSFGAYNSYGVWSPSKYTGTYGTNGFYLNFQDNSALTTTANVGIGKDSSGNGNYWTSNNISITAGVTYDSMLDVPTLTSATNSNYAVMNPLDKDTSITISDANLTVARAAGAYSAIRGSFLFPTSGKYYAEATVVTTTAAGTSASFGFSTDTAVLNNAAVAGQYILYGAGSGASAIYSNGSSLGSLGIAFSAGDILQIAFDGSTGKAWVGRNNVWYNATAGTTGDPANGTNNTFSLSGLNIFPVIVLLNDSMNFNAGQRPFSYTPPTGFNRLCTYNLPDSIVPVGAQYMAATTYTGNGSTQSITNTVNGKSFQPDLVWVKGRSVAYNNYLEDSVRGVGKDLSSNLTDAEATYNLLTAFNSNGFTAFTNGTYLASNQNGTTYVAWQWRASNASAVSNTSGSITSQVSANQTAGFSIVSWTGIGGNVGRTIGHGLNVAPKMIIVKDRTAGTTGTDNWPVYHASITAANFLLLNTTAASTTSTVYWNNTAPTTSVFSVGGNSANVSNESGVTYIGYCFAAVPGYSAFGSYTGNGSTDGPFVYLGFRPRFVLYKSATEVTGWAILDTSRSPSNVADKYLNADTSAAEATASLIDIISNGFKVRNTFAGNNTNGATYIYAAFAENPFKNSLAR